MPNSICTSASGGTSGIEVKNYVEHKLFSLPGAPGTHTHTAGKGAVTLSPTVATISPNNPCANGSAACSDIIILLLIFSFSSSLSRLGDFALCLQFRCPESACQYFALIRSGGERERESEHDKSFYYAMKEDFRPSSREELWFRVARRAKHHLCGSKVGTPAQPTSQQWPPQPHILA